MGLPYRSAHDIYEAGAYKANPCDAGTWPLLRPLGRGLAALSVACPCCSGARIVALFVVMALLPDRFEFAVGAVMLVIVLSQILLNPEFGYAHSQIPSPRDFYPAPSAEECAAYAAATSVDAAITVLHTEIQDLDTALNSATLTADEREQFLLEIVQLTNAVEALEHERERRNTARNALITLPPPLQ